MSSLVGPAIDLQNTLGLDPQSFNREYRRNPIKRPKRRGFLRNTAIAAGNSRDLTLIPALSAALSDTEADIRMHAAWALGVLGGDESLRALENAITTERDGFVKAEITGALEALSAPLPSDDSE